MLLATKRLSFAMTAVFAALMLWAGMAVAQNYETLPIAERYQVPTLTGRETPEERSKLSPKIAEGRKNISEDSGSIQESLKSNAARGENFDRFFLEYLFAEMAQTSDEYLSTLGTRRSDFLRRYLSADVGGENRRHLIEQLLLPTMKRIAEGNYHPSARLNAVLLIGLSNSAEAGSGGSDAPQPNAECVAYLNSLIKQDQLPLYVRIAAFTGLHRVAQIEGLRPGLDQNLVKEISNAALAIAENKAAGQDQWDPDASYWLRRRAVQILGFLRNQGENLAVVNSLYGILSDEKNQFNLRLDAVEALSELNLTEAAAAKVKDVSEGVTKLAGDALVQQADKIRTDVEDYIAINLLNKGPFLLRSGSAPSSSAGGQGRDTPKMNAGGGLDGGGDAPGGGNQQAGKDPDAPLFDMPNYYLNMERRACKNYVFICQNLLGNGSKWYAIAPENERKLFNAAGDVLGRVMEKSDVGLVDLGKSDTDKDRKRDAREDVASEDKKGPVKGAAWEMLKLLESSGKKLKDLVADRQNADANAPPAAAEK